MFKTFESDDSLFHEYSAHSTDFYSIPPVIGEDALTTESLTSYICRESEAHHVLPATLIGGTTGRVGAPLDMTSLKNASAAINGIGILSARWIKFVEEMTGRPDISRTTIQHLSGVISARHLMKAHRAWCGACLAEFERTSKKIIYEPLIWTIKDYNACIVHKSSLQSTCPNCGRCSLPLEGHTRNGHCGKCGLWLGTPDDAQPAMEEDLAHSSAVNSILTLLAASEKPQLEILRILNAAFSASKAANYEELSVICGVPSESLRGWHYKTSKPSFRDITTLVHVFKINIGEVRVRESETLEPGKGHKPNKTAPRDLTIQEFIGFVKKNPNILYLKEICKIFKIGKSFFYGKHRLEASELLKILEERQKRNQGTSVHKIIDTIVASKTQEPPPSLLEVSIQCGCHISNLYRNYNEECKEITRRYKDYKKIKAINCQISRRKALEKTISDMANEGIYPSMRVLREASPGGIKNWQIALDRSEIFFKKGIPIKRFRNGWNDS